MPWRSTDYFAVTPDCAYQNRHLLTIEVASSTQQRRVPPGTYAVRTNQPLSNLIVYLLEPASNDGLATWNLFQPELTAGQRVSRVAGRVTLPTKADNGTQ